MSYFFEEIHCKRGAAYKDADVVRHSHYKTPIDESRALRGKSRRHGDASPETQEEIIKLLIEQGLKHKLSVHEIAVVVALGRLESGFNPDAAAGTTSALGVGQFINDTGEKYGLTAQNRFEADIQCDALIRLTMANREHAAGKGYAGTDLDEMTYKYHHDGWTKEYGGRAIAKEHLVPWIPVTETLIKRYLNRGFRIPMDHTGTERLSTDGHFYKSHADLKVSAKLLDGLYKHTEKLHKGGYFPLGANTTWHGGVHLHAAANPVMPVIACAPGEVIAARLEKVEDEEQNYWGSRNFVLMRHHLDEQTVLQCLALHIPVEYTITKGPVTFDAPEEAPPLAPGDVLVRSDPEAGRKESDKTCKARIRSLNPTLSLLEGYNVIGGASKLYKDKDCKEVLLDLVIGDRLHLAKPVDRHKGDPEPAPLAEVRLTNLAVGLVDPWAWKVKPADFRRLRKDKNDDRDPDPETKKDRNRVLDLLGGDVVEKVDHDKAGELINGKSWHEVKVKLAEGKSQVTGYEITKAAWSLRTEAVQDDDKRVGSLSKGDLVDLVQPATIQVKKNVYDLVKLTKLVGKTAAEYVVTSATLKIHGSPGGPSIATAKKNDTLRVTGMARKQGQKEWVPVETADCTAGFIHPGGGVSPVMKEKMDTPWCKDLVGCTFFVDAGKYGNPITAPREAADVTGWVAESGDLTPTEGAKREEKYAASVTTPDAKDTPPEKTFFVKVPASTLAEFGQTRHDRFKTAINLEGELTIDTAKMRVRTDVPTEAKRHLIGAEYYSLYMHLRDRDPLKASDKKLLKCTWLPRVPSEYTIGRRRTSLYADAARQKLLLDLVSGDVLEAAGKPTSNVRHARIKHLESKEVLVEIEVKAAAVLWKNRQKTEPLVALAPGDVLIPGADYADGKMRHVRVKKLAPGTCDAEYVVKKAGKSLFPKPSSAGNPTKKKLAVGDKLKVLAPCEIGGPVWNYVDKAGSRGWVSLSKAEDQLTAAKATRDAVQGDRAKEAGFIEWDAKSFKEIKKDRAELHKAGEEGWFELVEYVEIKEVLDEEVLTKLRTGEVVNLAIGGQDQPNPVFPTVAAGAPLFWSGKFGAVDEEDELHKRMPMIHWEIFSASNLLRFHKEWSMAEDVVDDYNVDNPAIMDTIRKALEAERKGKADEVLGSDNLIDEKEVVDFYGGQGDGAKAMRRFACRFVGEWGINLDTALPALRNVGVMRWFSQFVGKTKNQVSPQLWWDEAVQKRKVPLPGNKRIFHYNPITFVEDFSEATLKDEAVRGPSLKLCDTSPFASVVAFIHKEMVTNATGAEVAAISWLQRSWDWEDMLTGKATEQMLAAYYAWFELVKPGGDWDHKPKIKAKFGMHTCDFPSRLLYQYDIWSNIHYGYVGLAAGFEKWVLKTGAGIGQVMEGLKNVPDGYWKRRWEQRGQFAVCAALDDPRDQEAIKIGFDLWSTYGASVTVQQVMDAVRNLAPKLATMACEAQCDAPRQYEEVEEEEEASAQEGGKKELSGKAWVKQFPGDNTLDTLAEPFKTNMTNFKAALDKAKAAVSVSATFRPVERAYLMHYAWDISKGTIKPQDVPPKAGVNIEWDHDDDDASIKAAEEMVKSYKIDYRPALESRHTERLAIDMTISWEGDLEIENADKTIVVIKSTPRTGKGNTDLHAVGATYGVHKLLDDAPHWSSDGH